MADAVVNQAPEFDPAEFIHAGNVVAETVCANIRANAGRDLPAVGFRKIAVCGNGPSLGDHIEEIRQRQAAGWHVAAMNGSYNFLLAHHIVPTFFFMVDARKAMNLKFVATPSQRTQHIIASQCDPEIFEALNGFHVHMWHVFNYPGALEALEKTAAPGTAKFSGACNVGHSCLIPLTAMGYRDFALFGYDCSTRDGARHALKQDNDADEPVVGFGFPLNEDGSARPDTRIYYTTPTMAHAATLLPDRIGAMRAQGIKVRLHGDGLGPHMVAALTPPETAGQVTTAAELAPPPMPSPLPRMTGRPTNGLPIVTFKWRGHIPYSVEDVRIWASGISRNMTAPHELVVITDEPAELESAVAGWPASYGKVRVLPMWRDRYQHGRDWHRLKLFASEMASLIGARFAVTDLDTVFCGDLAPLFDTDAPFKAWCDPNRDQYCSALMLMDAGAFPHVWRDFDPEFTMALRARGIFGGYDQAWISYALPGMPRWMPGDGVMSFKKDVMGWPAIREQNGDFLRLYRDAPPAFARVVNFHGEYKPRDADVQNAFPWIAKHYR